MPIEGLEGIVIVVPFPDNTVLWVLVGVVAVILTVNFLLAFYGRIKP